MWVLFSKSKTKTINEEVASQPFYRPINSYLTRLSFFHFGDEQHSLYICVAIPNYRDSIGFNSLVCK